MRERKLFEELTVNLQLLANPNTNVTSAKAADNDLSPTMKEYYNTELLENARADLYFNQFGKEEPLPKNHGDTIEFRRWETFKKATTPLTEGVTPDGNKLCMEKKTKKISQYGDYSTISDSLELRAIDNVILGATEEHGAQAGETLDTITRNELLTGTHVMYAGGKTSRKALVAADKITATLVNKAVTHLKKMKTPKINGKYIAIIHPSVAEDLREDPSWIEVHKYAATTEIFNGEIGELHGVRFVETTEQKVWDNAGAAGEAVYATMFFGKDAWAIIKPTAESMKMIIKPKGSAGSADPLDQRSTVGWKASHAALILYPERLVRLETCSSYSTVDGEN